MGMEFAASRLDLRIRYILDLQILAMKKYNDYYDSISNPRSERDRS